MNKLCLTLIIAISLSLVSGAPASAQAENSGLRWKPLATRTFAGEVAFGLQVDMPGTILKHDLLTLSALMRGAEIAEVTWVSDPAGGLYRPVFSMDARFSRFRYPFPDMDGLFENDRIFRLEASVSAGTNLPGGVLLVATAGLDRFAHDSPFYREEISYGLPPAPEGAFGFLTVAAELDRLDRDFYPSRGFRLRAARKEWGMFQDESDIRTRLHALSGSLFISLPRSILSVHGASVTSSGPCPLYLRRHLGGERTIRGREFGMLSGDNCLLLRNELSIPLNFRDISELGNPVILVDLSLFADMGAAWDDGQRLSDQELFGGFGVCLDFIPQQDWLLKIGSMWNSASNGSFYFDIGTSF